MRGERVPPGRAGYFFAGAAFAFDAPAGATAAATGLAAPPAAAFAGAAATGAGGGGAGGSAPRLMSFSLPKSPKSWVLIETDVTPAGSS